MHTQLEFYVRGLRPDTADALREYAVHRLSFIANRFGDRVRRITVRLVDENGPRGGVDTRSSIAADLVDGTRVFVEGTAAWPFAAVTLAASRLNEALRRAMERRTLRQHRGSGMLRRLDGYARVL